MKNFFLALTCVTAFTALSAHADCLTDEQVQALHAAYTAKQAAANPQNLNTADGECSRGKLLKRMEAQLGAPIGYKAGLTNPAVQKRFNADAPVWGALYAGMVLPEGIPIEANFGARPLFEADMLLRVSSAAINQAKTVEDVLANIDQVIPFIELPDLVVQAPPQLNGAAIAAINVGARLGVGGTPVHVKRTAEFANALRDMTVIVKVDGVEADRGKGSDVLGHPLNGALWLVQDLQRNGIALKPGQLLSLGSFSKLLPPKAGQKVSVEYQGLGDVDVGLVFK
jgi:2-keto-4-pentenoate hydratase